MTVEKLCDPSVGLFNDPANDPSQPLPHLSELRFLFASSYNSDIDSLIHCSCVYPAPHEAHISPDVSALSCINCHRSCESVKIHVHTSIQRSRDSALHLRGPTSSTRLTQRLSLVSHKSSQILCKKKKKSCQVADV